ncbi:MAG: substrate-binding domain-containing protein [Pirellulaceae bacterium]|nr:extracellular solute-binding protein [Planctomycetales bacterium]
MIRHPREGRISPGPVLALVAAAAILSLLGFMLWGLGRPTIARDDRHDEARRRSGNSPTTSEQDDNRPLLVYCAAGMRPSLEKIADDYELEYEIATQLQYGGSNTLLSQIEVSQLGDLFVSADVDYLELGRQRGLVREILPLARIRPVIVVRKGNPKGIQSIQDLLRSDVTTALGSPEQAAIGRTTRTLLEKAGIWSSVSDNVTRTGVFKPTVPEVANDVKLGSVDAGIVWDTTLPLYPDLQAIPVPELEGGTTLVAVGVLSSTSNPTAALRLARYIAARDKGLAEISKHGYVVVDGDAWAEVPELTFFCGAVNRRAVDAVISRFQQREGAVVNTVYNGCGILTAQMKTMHEQGRANGFPDTYMACDRYYLESVKEWFQDDVNVSNTRVVIAVPKGNPSQIHSLNDLTKPGIRVAVGQPDQCTIGVLTRNVLQSEGVYDAVIKNVVTQTASSAMLVPTVATGSVDAALAYSTDTNAESDKVDTIEIPSDAAIAVQPFAIAKSSQHKQLGHRLLDSIAAAARDFESAGFQFLLDRSSSTAANE